MLPKTKTIKLTQTEFQNLPEILQDELLNSEIESCVNKEYVKNELTELNFLLKRKYGMLLFNDEDYEKTFEALEDENIHLEYLTRMDKLIFYVPSHIIKELAIARSEEESTPEVHKKVLKELSKTTADEKSIGILVDVDKLLTNNKKVLELADNQTTIDTSNTILGVIEDMAPYLINICKNYKEAEEQALEKFNKTVFYIDKNFNIYETADKRTEEVKIKQQKLGM
jgi:hypothetical protein